MKTKFTLLFTLLFFCFNSSFAQNKEKCKTNLSIFHEYVKTKNYDAAYEPWEYLRNNCPELNIAIYKEGEEILEAKIEQNSEEDKISFINDL